MILQNLGHTDFLKLDQKPVLNLFQTSSFSLLLSSLLSYHIDKEQAGHQYLRRKYRALLGPFPELLWQKSPQNTYL
jgi:hypothetical protein